MPKALTIDEISKYEKLQVRERINTDQVREYVDVLDDSNGKWPFPPLMFVNDVLVDGFHRLAAQGE